MSKRNSNFSIYTHLRMLLRAIPMRNEATLRLAIAARIEADEATGEIFSRGETSPRGHLQDVANVPRSSSLDDAMAMLRKLKLIQGRRSYVGGQRQKGGDRLVLDWSQWEDVCLADAQKQIAQARCTPVSEVQPPCTPVSGVQQPTLSGVQQPTLSGVQHNKDTATETAIDTAGGPSPSHGAPSPRRRPRKVADAEAPSHDAAEETPQPPSDVELQGQQVGVAWTELPPANWGWPVHTDSLGRVCFVFSKAGRKAYAELMEAGFTPEDIVRAQQTCGPRLAKVPGFQTGPVTKAALAMGVVLSACRYAQEERQKRETWSKPKPKTFSGPTDYRQRDAVLVGSRFK